MDNQNAGEVTPASNAKSDPKEFHYKVDGVPYKSDQASLTGAQIKAKIPDFNPAYQLVEEGRRGEPDKVIGDQDTVNLDAKPELEFYTVPPATFGK